MLVSDEADNDPPELRRRIGEEGYLFLRRLVDPDLLWGLRMQLLKGCQDAGWIGGGTNLADDLADVSFRCTEGAVEHIPVCKGIQKLEASIG